MAVEKSMLAMLLNTNLEAVIVGIIWRHIPSNNEGKDICSHIWDAVSKKQ